MIKIKLDLNQSLFSMIVFGNKLDYYTIYDLILK